MGETSYSSLPGKAFGSGSPIWLNGDLQFCDCDRAKEAYMHGIRTHTHSNHDSVFEMSFYDPTTENWALLQQTKSLFGSQHQQLNALLHHFQFEKL
ncbi:hypothetical protein HN51_023497 [Arachis hypogaea]